MEKVIALAGNPNSGKTSLFNILTGANQFVGNWPGVTVEKKEGKIRKTDIRVIDLPGIYSLSPYSPEEKIARKVLMEEKIDGIINIIDGTSIERSLFLTSQLLELGIPVYVAINMADELKKAGYDINVAELEKALGTRVFKISALKNQGIKDLVKAIDGPAIAAPKHFEFKGALQSALQNIQSTANCSTWEAGKLLERDADITQKLALKSDALQNVEKEIANLEKELGDDSVGILTSARYDEIESILKLSVKKNVKDQTRSDKIDKIITNRFLALPIFALVMFLVYFVAVKTVGSYATDFVNEELFGDGFFLGPGKAAFEDATSEYETAQKKVEAFIEAAKEQGIELEEGQEEAFAAAAKDVVGTAVFLDDEGKEESREDVNFAAYQEAAAVEEPSQEDFGTFVKGIPVAVGGWLEKAEIAPWLHSLIIEGIIGGVGAVLGFVPQMFVLFFMLSILEACGYMARIAFMMDRIFRKFGLSGKSFIPVMIGTGCSVPGIMACRTIENERDRRMTITTTSFMVCGAKLPVVAMIAGAIFQNSAWIASYAYFLGIAAIILSGLILKKTKRFQGDLTPFVLELPAYRMPLWRNVLRSTWERGWSFIKKAGTIILLCAILIWFISKYGIVDGKFVEVGEDLVGSFAHRLGQGFGYIFAPLGFGHWKAGIATMMGLVAKENVVSTFGILYGFGEVSEKGYEFWSLMAQDFSSVAALAFLTFNLLCAPCFAAIGAIKREMNSFSWTSFAIIYQTIVAWVVSLVIYQLAGLAMGLVAFNVFTVVAIACVAYILYLLFRKDPSLQVK